MTATANFRRRSLVPAIVSKRETLEVIRITNQQSAFDLCADIRRSQSSISTPHVDEFDVHAEIYLLTLEGKPVATMRVNQAQCGHLDCEEFYPQDFLHEFRPQIGSASRFARHALAKPDIVLMREFVSEVWRDQFLVGIRADLINVHTPMISYYERLGYRMLCNSRFVHPRLGTESHVMCLVASPEVPGALGRVFQTSEPDGFVERMRLALNFCDRQKCSTTSACYTNETRRFACPCAEPEFPSNTNPLNCDKSSP